VAAVTFRDFGLPIIDAKGRIAFWARYQGTGAKGSAGLYVWNGTELELVVHDDPATAGTVPGRTSADYFGKRQGFDPRAYELAWGAGDRLIFVSDVTNGSNDSTGVYRWRASDGNLARVADAEQIAGTFPDVSQGQSGPVFGANFYGVPGVSDTGIAIFGVNYTYIKATGEGFERFVIEKNGIFTSNGTSVTKVADDSTLTKGVVPDQANDAYFIEVVVNTTINGLGDMLFQARYTTSSGNGRGAYLRRGSNNYRAIDSRAGASWPGLPSGAQIGKKQYRLALGPAGHIAIDTTINLGSGEQDTVLLWDPQSVKWTQLTGPNGVAASALLSGVNDDGQVVILAADGNPYLVSGSGRTQLNATLPAQLQGANLTWNDSGGSINNHGRVVLRFTHDGKPGLVMWTGARLLLVADAAADVPAGISDLSTVVGPERDRPGRTGMFNDRDELVFRVKYDDGSEALYLASGEP